MLEKRGVLSPEEIHRLASKTKNSMDAHDGEKASCHSDHVDTNRAKRLQERGHEQHHIAPGHDMAKNDSVI